MFSCPVVFASKAAEPIATFDSPVVFENNALCPIATQLDALFVYKADLPTAVLPPPVVLVY